MGKLSVYPNPVQSLSFVPLSIRRAIESRAQCPWCGSPMYLNRSGDWLQCVDAILCAGTVLVEEVMR